MPKRLVVVESPTKAKTLERYLGGDYSVKASYGHIRDLPKNKMGVDTDRDFTPEYVVSEGSQRHVSALKTAFKRADGLVLATDYDREGEAIAFHVAKVLGVDPSSAERVTFTEITEDAVREAFEHPRSVDLRLIEDREREIDAFTPVEYWTVDARLSRDGDEHSFLARLMQVGNDKLAASPDKKGVILSGEADAAVHVERLR